MRRAGLALGLALALLAPAAVAQETRDGTLADIRQELTVLFVEVQRLKRELSTTGSPQVDTGSGGVLDRVGTIEREVQRLTAKTEELEFRIDQIVRDGTNRIGDLEYRLVELEGGDVTQLGETTTLGGAAATTAATPPAAPAQANAPELATQEAADFARAREALDEGQFQSAAALFETFNQTYPGGPLSVEADLRRGDALDGLGDTREAARAYLQAFRGYQTGPLAPEALYKLGAALGRLGSQTEACVTLGEVPVRFPGSTSVAPAMAEMASLGCS